MAQRNFTDDEEVKIAKMYLDGKSARAIARDYGLSHHISITSALRRQGVTQRSPEERNRLYKLNPHAFDSLDNELSAYWHGFIYANGCMQRNKTLAINISIKDKKHLEKLKAFLESEAPIRINKNLGYGGPLAHFEVTDKHLGKQLIDTGIIVNRPYPEKLFDNLSDNMFQHWLRGFFDGDGSARKSKDVSFCGEKKLLEILRTKIALHCNTNPNLYISKHIKANLYYLYISGRLQALKVTDFMYKNATVWMERKRDVVESWVDPPKRERNKKGQFI